MSFAIVEVDDEGFQQWIQRTKKGFRSMSKTLETVARLVEEFTAPRTPFRSGKLVRSYKWTVLENSSKFQTVQVRMSALNERTGYDYAFVQHRGWHLDKDGHYVVYRKFNRSSSGEYYTVPSTWKTIETGPYSFFIHHGEDHYLKEGIIEAREDAFELIESDYISLFTRGHIY